MGKTRGSRFAFGRSVECISSLIHVQMIGWRHCLIIKFAGIGIVINEPKYLIRGRCRWSVTYTSLRGFLNLEFGIGHFGRENLISFPAV